VAVTVARRRERSGHPADQPGLDVPVAPNGVLDVVSWQRERDQSRELARRVKADLEAGLEPEDLLVVPIDVGPSSLSAAFALRGALRDAGVPAAIAGEDTKGKEFRKPGHVTIANVFRAKGNEAWKVYACNLHLAGVEH